MRLSLRVRARAALAAVGALGLALLAAPQAMATGETPTTPTDLFNGYAACSHDEAAPTYVWAGSGVQLEGVTGVVGGDGWTLPSEQFQLWPVADPAQITSLSYAVAVPGNEGWVTAPAGKLADGQVYAWQAQTVVGTVASEWSAPCYFAVDNTRPSTTPTVTSANYPQNQVTEGGDPVRFTFDANGVNDVEGFEFAWMDPLPVYVVSIGEHAIPQPKDRYADTKYYVRADSLGGSATVSLIPPGGGGPLTLHVVSLDRTGNRSYDEATYSFSAPTGPPTVTPPTDPRFDQPATFRFAPDAALQAKSPVVSYTVRTLGAQQDQTRQVPADADGSGKFTLKLDGAYGEVLHVTSTSANGWVSDTAEWSSEYNTETTVTSDVYAEDETSGGVGVPGTFTLTPKVPHVVSYTYSFNWGEPVTVEAGLGHAAQVTWTPTESGFAYLTVDATTADGIQLATRYYSFDVS
ncbi:hypothetical protein [Streptomyces sp. NBC_01477]|uniref:hypothetical protein n=1 Tax=Streptomyces sp. NBC_01477 TaxID=2976015 RepID=UPI002E303A22|nr:hypothetical protein [Streptomyces sp. NBC_01477]